MAILHITFDFPDQINFKKPKPVKNLIESQETYENIIFSLNRTSYLGDDFTSIKNNKIYSLKIFGLPYGIFLNFWMILAAKKILKIIKKEKINISIIHAHKLTFEGIIAYNISQKLKVPYIVTFRGHSDTQVIFYKLFLYNTFKKILMSASCILCVSPWSKNYILKKFRSKVVTEKIKILPNIVDLTNFENEGNSRENKFLTILNFNDYKVKNINRVIKAFDKVTLKHPELRLDIVGWGNEKNVNKIKLFISKSRQPNNYNILGPFQHVETLNLYKNYKGFVLPSYPETFGLVFIEALNSGTPIIYSKNSGIDGFFNEEVIGKRVSFNSVIEICEAIINIYEINNTYLQSIEKLKERKFLHPFMKENVANQYNIIISEIYAQNISSQNKSFS